MLQKLPGSRKRLVDLGSGDGVVVLELAKQFPEMSFHGVENNRALVYRAKYKAIGLSNATFECGDLFKSNLKGYDVIFICLGKQRRRK